jgi:hypothetical protein
MAILRLDLSARNFEISGDILMTNASVQPRLDLYRLIHKGLRAYMCDTLAMLGRTDFADAEARKVTLTQVRALLLFCRNHLKHENEHVHRAIELREPHGTDHIRDEHMAHERSIAELEAMVAEIEAATGAARETAGLHLYHQFGIFLAENFVHMLAEERDLNTILWRHFSDGKLVAIHQNILASLTPEESFEAMRWMIPATSPEERLQLLRGARSGMPAEAFAGMLGALKPLLSESDRTKLAAGLSAVQQAA